jgi:hypothetical protein
MRCELVVGLLSVLSLSRAAPFVEDDCEKESSVATGESMTAQAMPVASDMPNGGTQNYIGAADESQAASPVVNEGIQEPAKYYNPGPTATFVPIIHWDQDTSDLGNIAPNTQAKIYYAESSDCSKCEAAFCKLQQWTLRICRFAKNPQIFVA